MAQRRRRWRVLRQGGSVLLLVLLAISVVLALTTWVVLPIADVTAATDGGDLVLVADSGEETRLTLLGRPFALVGSWWGALVVLCLALALALLRSLPGRRGGHRDTWSATVRRHSAAMVAVPVVVVVLAGGHLTAGALEALEDARQTERAATALAALMAATAAVQAEAVAPAAGTDAATARTETDRALDALASAVAPVEVRGAAGSAALTVDAARRQVTAARDVGRTDALAAGEDLAGAVTALLGLGDDVVAAIPAPESAAFGRAAVATDRLAADLEREALQVQQLFAGPRTDGSGPAEPDPALVRQAALTVASTDAQRRRTEAVLATVRTPGLVLPEETRTVAEARAVVAAGEPALVAESVRAGWTGRAASQAELTRAVGGAAVEALQTRAAEATVDARTATSGVLAVAVLTLVLSGLVSLTVAHRLRARPPVSAEAPVGPTGAPGVVAVASAPVASAPVASTSVASSPVVVRTAPAPVDAVPVPVPEGTGAARRPAGAPAPAAAEASTALLVRIAQREQALAARQLVLLDELERSEVDPDVLTRLFELDNLATRSRRGAESVLALVGDHGGRRERDATTLSDVVRIASAQIEQYDRVRLDLGADPLLVGHAVVGVAHLLAELLENATTHSDPLLPVRVASTAGPDAVEVAITDAGLGMSDQERAAAEHAVGADAMPVDGRLGLAVVGRLARSTGARVSFPAGESGTTVLVRLPSALVEAAPGERVAQVGEPAPPTTAGDSSPWSVAPRPGATEPLVAWTPTSFLDDPGDLASRLPAESMVGGSVPGGSVPGEGVPGEGVVGWTTGAFVPQQAPEGSGPLAARGAARDPEEVRARMQRFRTGVLDGQGHDAEPGPGSR